MVVFMVALVRKVSSVVVHIHLIAHLPRVERVPYFVATAAEYVGY